MRAAAGPPGLFRRSAVLIATLVRVTGWGVAGAARSELRRGGTLLVALPGEPAGHFDPLVTSDSGSLAILANIVEALYKYDAELRPVPWLAESVEEPDELTYIFNLRRVVMLHDGTEMDAAAVKFGVDRIRMNPASPGYADGQGIVESTVVDQSTYRIALKEPFAPFPPHLVRRLGTVVSPTAVRLNGDVAFNRNPVGTGPFRFGGYERERMIRVERFDSYWRMGADNLPLPYLGAVEWRFIQDPWDRLAALEEGLIHIGDVPIAADESIRRNRELTLTYSTEASLSDSGLLLSVAAPPFDNRALRQALQYAIDRHEINQYCYDGGRIVAHGPIPPAFRCAVDPGYQPYAYDPIRAREKRREGGRPDGFEFEVLAQSSDEELVDLIQDQLADGAFGCVCA